MIDSNTPKIRYDMPTQGSKFMDDVLGGRIKQLDGVWYWTNWHVSYAQGGMDTSDNFITQEEAETHFQKRLAECRGSWSPGGRAFSETPELRSFGGKAIRFRSILKSGKPGQLRGILYMDPIRRP